MPPSHSGYKYALQAATGAHAPGIHQVTYRQDDDQGWPPASILVEDLSRLGRVCERLHSDRGGEFTAQEWADMCND